MEIYQTLSINYLIKFAMIYLTLLLFKIPSKYKSFGRAAIALYKSAAIVIIMSLWSILLLIEGLY